MTTKKIAIFGENASALLTALAFSKAGHEVEIYDRGQHFLYETPRFIAPEFSFWPSSEKAFEDLAWLESLLEISLGGVEVDMPPATFDGETVVPFVGFGDKRYSSIPAASVFNRRARLQLNFTERAIYQRLREQTTCTVHEFSEISQITLGRDGVQSVQINGAKDVTADLFIFCQSPAELIRIAPTDFFSSRLLSRLARIETYSQLTLTVNHPNGFVAQNLLGDHGLVYLLPPQNDQEPAIGQVSEKYSIWQSYLPAEASEDAEIVANVFRNMRKLVDRHFGSINPNFSEELRKASIHMQPEALADYPTDEALDVFKKSNNNALLASPLWSAFSGLAGAVDASRRAFEGAVFPETAKALPTSLEAST